MNLITLFALSHFIIFSDFSKLPLQEQYSYLSDNIYEKSQVVQKVAQKEDLPARYSQIYMKSKKEVDELYFEANYYSSVGEFNLTYSILHSSDDQVLGFEVKVFQEGCMYPEDHSSHGSPSHFNTAKEANADSCSTDEDVSWTACMTFDLDGNLIEELSDDYFEWTGH